MEERVCVDCGFPIEDDNPSYCEVCAKYHVPKVKKNWSTLDVPAEHVRVYQPIEFYDEPFFDETDEQDREPTAEEIAQWDREAEEWAEMERQIGERERERIEMSLMGEV